MVNLITFVQRFYNEFDRRIEMEWSTRHPDNYTDYQNNERFSERNRCKCIKEVDPWFQEGKFYEYREKIENPDEVYVYYDRGLHLQFNEGIFKDYFLDRDSIIDSILRK